MSMTTGGGTPGEARQRRKLLAVITKFSETMAVALSRTHIEKFYVVCEDNEGLV